MAADYTRVIVFKVEDQAIKRATDRITRSLEGIEKTLGRIEQKGGFGKIAKEADVAAKSIDKLSKSARGWKGFRSELQKNLMTTKGGARTIGVGVLGAGMGANWLNNQLRPLKDAASAILHPFGKATEAATGKTAALSAGLTKLSALASAQPHYAIAMAVAYMAFGDQINRVAKQGIVGLLGGLDNLGKKAYDATGLWRPLNYELKETVKLQEQVIRQQNLFKLPGGRITSRNRGFGTRQQGTAIEEEVRMRNRAINQRAAEHREARMILEGNAPISRARRQAIRLDAEFKNLPTVKAVRQLHAIEKKRLLIHQRNLRATEKLRMMAETAGLPGSTGFTAAQYGPQPAPLNRMQRWGIGKGANPKGWAASPGGVGGRWKGAAQSGMIGGGFPLLFGQSGLASTLGGIGGALGGALSPGFGFAGSIVATAAAQKIQEIIDFRKSVTDLNKEMKLMGIDAEFSAGQIAKLGKSLGLTKQEALEIAKGFKRYGGKTGGLFAEFFGDAQVFEATAGAIDIQSAIAAIKAQEKDMTVEQELRYRIMLQTQGVEETINALVEKRIKATREAFKEDQKNQRSRESARNLSYWGGMSYHRDSFTEQQQKDLDAQIEKEKELIRQFEKQRDLRNDLALAAERQAQSVNTAIESVEKELRKLTNAQYQIVQAANSISTSFSESFRGIVSGSMTAQDALRNLFQRTADHFLDMAAQIAATQLRRGILSLFSSGFNWGGKGGFTGMDLPSGYYSGSGGGGRVNWTDIAGQKAAGGPVTGGKSYVVGEEGPELFVPGSSGNIVPNHDMGGSTNIVVNVDASGSAVQGDAGQAEELGSMLAAAVQAEIINQQRPGGLLA